MNTMSRYVWLDYVKSIAILLVVLFHSDAVTCKATSSILAIGVPLFFVANGALVLREERDIHYFIKKLFKIFFLILFWGTISSLTAMLHREEGFSVVTGMMYALHLRFGYAHIFWFMATLFVLYCIYPIIQHSVKNKSVCLFLLVVSFVFSFQAFGYRVPTFEIPNVFAWWQGECVFYAVAGYVLVSDLSFGELFKEKKGIAQKWHEKNSGLWAGIFCVLFFLALYSVQQLMWVNIPFFARHTPSRVDDAVFIMYRSPFVMLMTIIVVYTCKKVFQKEQKLIMIIGSNTLGIYVTHCLFMSGFQSVISLPNPFLSRTIVFALSFVSSLLFSVVMMKNKLSRFFVTL